MSLERLQRLAIWVAVAGFLLGLPASTGHALLPMGPPGAAWVLHPFVLLLGVGGGFATLLRKQRIDATRWQTVQDDQLTSGERQYAHSEAEREIRLAGTAFLLGAVGFAYLLTYQIHVENEITAGDFLIVTALFGFLAGLLAGMRLVPEVEPDQGR